MHHLRFAGLRGPASLALLALCAVSTPSVHAQSFGVHVSTSSDAQISGLVIADEEVLTRNMQGMMYVSVPTEASSAMVGELTTSGLHHVFGDVDALHEGGGYPVGSELFLSLVSNEAGYLDGDVLRGTPASGFSVFLGEADFVMACGLTDGNADIDAFHKDGDGSVFFSFAEDEDSSFLSGDTPGVVADGDILKWNPFLGSADVFHRESEVGAFVSQALGSATSIGDVKGVARNPLTGALLFTVQSPSSHDASIFTDAGGGELMEGYAEASWGFSSATEFDALSVATNLWPSLDTSDSMPAAGASGSLKVDGADPGEAYIIFAALSLGPSQVVTAGWGGLVLSADALFLGSLNQLALRTVVTDSLGQAQLGFTIPTGVPATDIFVQAVAAASPHPATNPLVIEVAQ